MGACTLAQVLWVQQHTLQKNKIMFLNRNLDQNMPKYFFRKTCKMTEASL